MHIPFQIEFLLNRMQKSSFFIIVIFWCSLLISGCTGIRRITLQSELKNLPQKSPVISKYFMGLTLYDPIAGAYLSNVNGEKYFTPASNTKLMTLASWLSTGLDSIPSFSYWKEANKLYIRPMGDPTFLHPDFPIQSALEFLENPKFDSIFIIAPKQVIPPYGSGWAWDDYMYEYQPERSVMPLYGNTVHMFIDGNQTEVVPSFFEKYIETTSQRTYRSLDYNYFELPVSKYLGDTTELQVPFRLSEELMVRLLRDTLHKAVRYINHVPKRADEKVFYGYDRLPVLALMMLRSDNFLAEQLLLNAALYSGYSSTDAFIQNKKETLFAKSPHKLEWVDGSGLSRYNMFTPMTMVNTLDIIYKQLSWKEINLIFPKGGYSGTIKNWYWGPEPYVFAKTGTLRHNHCLSGYIQTKSGRRLIFSFMNNHYTNGTTEVKQEMQRILEAIRDAY